MFLAQRLLHDITAFTLTVDEPERNRLLQQFRAYSYDRSSDGAKQAVSGPGITFTLIPAKPGAARTLLIEFSVNRTSTGEQMYKLGEGGEIRIQGSTGKWVFTFPNDGSQVMRIIPTFLGGPQIVDLATRRSLPGGHQQFLDGAQAADHV